MASVFNTIVVATDFSPNADRALAWAIALAKVGTGGAHLVLVHAVEPEAAAIDLLEGPLTEAVRKGMDKAQQTVSAAGLKCSLEQHRGKPWQVIANAAKMREADLIVVGSRGRTGYKRLLLGSTTDRLIRIAPTPVFVVHPNDPVPSADHGIKSVLVPVDFSEESSIATSVAAQVIVGNPRGGRMVLLHTIELVVEWPAPDLPTLLPRYWDDEENAAKVRLESIAASYRTSSLNVEIKTTRGYAPDAIEHECKSGIDLVAMGTRGKGGVDRMMIGSVAERVLQHVPCPVLVVHRPGANDPIRVSA